MEFIIVLFVLDAQNKPIIVVILCEIYSTSLLCKLLESRPTRSTRYDGITFYPNCLCQNLIQWLNFAPYEMITATTPHNLVGVENIFANCINKTPEVGLVRDLNPGFAKACCKFALLRQSFDYCELAICPLQRSDDAIAKYRHNILVGIFVGIIHLKSL